MATSQIATVSTRADKAKLVAAAALVLAAIAGFYFYSQSGALVQWAILLVGIALALVVFLVSVAGRQLIGFSRESWREVKKVVWPTRKETMQMTAYVAAFAVVMALFLWFTDKVLQWTLYDLILGWKR